MSFSTFSPSTIPALALFTTPVRAWFQAAFPEGPTPAQELAWPPIAAGEHVLLVSPTGTGKTLAAFLAILDRLFRAHESGTLATGLRCVYVSPLRSLNYDIERNLSTPLEGIGQRLGCEKSPVRVGVRTGDTSAYERRRLRDHPPHVLITTPESLSLLLSQPSWRDHWRGVEHIVVDEVHALAPTKRGADLAVSLERLAAHAERDPIRIGLSATCRDGDAAARFLVGPSRSCRVVEAPPPAGTPPVEIEVESLIRPGEAPHRGLSYRRLLRRLKGTIARNRTTVVFANTRAFAEKLTLRPAARLARRQRGGPCRGRAPLGARCPEAAGDRDGAAGRRAPGGCHQHEPGAGRRHRHGRPDGPGRAARRRGAVRAARRPVGPPSRRGSRGLLLAATPAELAGAVITAQAALAGRVEPLRMIAAPLDVVCQQLIGMACAGEQNVGPCLRPLPQGGARWPS